MVSMSALLGSAGTAAWVLGQPSTGSSSFAAYVRPPPQHAMPNVTREAEALVIYRGCLDQG